MDAITANGLGKSYDSKPDAIKGLTLHVPEGDVYGFLGPNGAGKTTTVKLLTGLLKPSDGECAVMGFSPLKNPSDVHRVCGVMTDTARMYGHLTGTQNLTFFAQTSGIERPAAAERAQELLKQLGLWEARDRKLSAYSTGMMQRLSLARALVHRPRVLFLDEPTSGLDPESAQAVNTMIETLATHEGTTVFLCTHQLRYAEDLCNGYGIVDKGSLLAGGSFSELCAASGRHSRAAFRLKDGDSLDGFTAAPGNWWQADLPREESMPALLKSAVAKHDVFEARVERPSLEDIYFTYIQKEEAAQE